MADEPIREGETWVSKDPRDGGKQVTVLYVGDHFIAVKAFRRSRVRVQNFRKLYRPLVRGAADD